MTSGPDGVLFSRDHLWVRITDGAAVVAMTNTFLTCTTLKVHGGEPWT